MQFEQITFGRTKDNESISIYRHTHADGTCLELTDYGCRIRSLCVLDKNNRLRDVCLGYDTLADYEADRASLGAAIGRHANRIGGASFFLKGKTFPLGPKDGKKHLHGGSKRFAFRKWNGKNEDERMIFSRRFADGEDGYPGNLDVRITYQWTQTHCLMITYEAISDQDTICNFTNHSYFNLEGPKSRSVLQHRLWLASSSITENDAESIPTGVFLPVDDTPFDFRNEATLGARIDAAHPQLVYGLGYDHNFVLDGSGFRKAAVLTAPASGIQMTCYTDQPGLQLYTANYLDNCKGKYGEAFCPRNSVCLETQHFPNAVHHPHFPSVRLKAGEHYTTKTWYQFAAV